MPLYSQSPTTFLHASNINNRMIRERYLLRREKESSMYSNEQQSHGLRTESLDLPSTLRSLVFGVAKSIMQSAFSPLPELY